jgi:hypothetical protein
VSDAHSPRVRRERRRLAALLGVLAIAVAAVALVALTALLTIGAAQCGVSDEAAAPMRRAGVDRPPIAAPPVITARRAPRAVPAAPPPVRIEIPAIGVRAPVIRLGLNRDRTLEVPRRFGDTGWWSGGARPGERGPAVIVGHVDSHTGPAVFYRLGQLRRGDAIRVIRRDGSVVRFVVQRRERHSKRRFPTETVYGPTRVPALRLITCSGAFDRDTGHYLDNAIVFATAA